MYDTSILYSNVEIYKNYQAVHKFGDKVSNYDTFNF